MITKLGVKNFKSWKSIEDMRLAPITGLFGANSSGKSSILQLLLLLKQTVDSPDRAQVLNLGGDRSDLVDFGRFQDIIFDHRINNLLNIQLSWNHYVALNPTHVTFDSSIGYQTETGLFVDHINYDADYSFGNPRLFRTNDDKFYKLIMSEEYSDVGELIPMTPIKCFHIPFEDLPNFTITIENYRIATPEKHFIKLFNKMHYLGPLREFPERQYQHRDFKPTNVGKRGEQFFGALLTSSETKTLTAKWLENLGLAHDFGIDVTSPKGRYEVWIRYNPDSAKVLLPDVGFGVSQILPVLAQLFYVPKGSIVLLEQPELHLHPAVQSELADVFIEVAKQRNIQIIFESHSEHLLTRLQRRMAEEKLDPDKVALYFCEMENSASKLITLEHDEYGNIKNWPRNFFGDGLGERAAWMEAEMQRKIKAKR